MNPVHILRALGGTAEWSELACYGASRRALDGALSAGAVVRVRRGCYSLPTADRERQAVVAWRGSLTCLTALRAHGLPCPSPGATVHLARDAYRSESGRNLRAPAHIVWHQWRPGHDAASPLASHLDLACRCLTPMDQLIAIDAALHRELLTRADVAAFRATPTRRRLWLLRHADARTMSPPETRARVAFRRARLPYAFQVPLPGVGDVDFVIDGRLVVEIDGLAYHGDGAAFRRDRARVRAASLLGLETWRYTAIEVERDAAAVAAEVWRKVRLLREQ